MRIFAAALSIALAIALPFSVAPAAPPPPPRPGIAVSPLATGPGCMVQSTYGASANIPGNFEVVVLEGNELVHYWRSNAERRLAWHRGEVITRSASGPGCIIQSSLGTEHGNLGNLEVVVQEGSNLAHYSKKHNGRWERAAPSFGSNVSSGPSFIQGTLKTSPGAVHGNFELVVREGANNLVHYWRDNSTPGRPWQKSNQMIATTATGGGSIWQSTITPAPGAPRNFEVVFQEGDHIAHKYHDNRSPTNRWEPAGTFASNVTGPPSLIQSTFGTEGNRQGNFEVVFRQGTNLVHWYKIVAAGGPWRPGRAVATDVISSASLIQSTIKASPGAHGNFELVVVKGRQAAEDQPFVPPDSRVEGAWTDYLLVHYYHDNTSENNPWMRAQIVTHRGRSEKICQLTGEVDRETGALTKNKTATQFGLASTDLGYPVDDGRSLTLYFGDSRRTTGQPLTDESGWDDTVGISYQTELPNPTDCLAIDVPAPGGRFDVLRVNETIHPPRFYQGLFNVPSSGFSVGSTAYTIFWTNHCWVPNNPAMCPRFLGTDQWVTREGRGALTRNTGLTTFRELFSLPSKFKYTAAINSDNVDGLPVNHRLGVYVWGVPTYRESDPRLAYVPSGQVEDLLAWRYLKGVDDNRVPQWSDPGRPDEAQPVFETGGDSCIGELSVSWVAPLQRWLMLYNCGPTVRARFALDPWGPWSAPTEIFEPSKDNAFCRYMQAPNGANCIDYLGGDNAAWGLPYAPYVLSRFTRATPQGAAIYFLISTWNPYQVVIMRANLTVSPHAEEFHLVAKHSGKCLHQHGGTHGDGDSITQWDCADQPNVKLRKLDAEKETFFLQFVHSGKCVHLDRASADDDAAITQWSCINQPNVLWRAMPASDGYSYFISSSSSKCIHQKGATNENDDPVTQWACVDQPNVQWKLIPVP